MVSRGLLATPDCTGCPLRGSRIIPPEGDTEAEVAIVGEAPGQSEELDGRPFVGVSGRLLTVLLERQGIQRDRVWVSNALLCRIRTVVTQTAAGVRTVLSPEQVKNLAAQHCHSRLIAELQAIRPRVIVALGATALSSLRGRRESVTKRRGAVHTIDLSLQATAPATPPLDPASLAARPETAAAPARRAASPPPGRARLIAEEINRP